MEKTNASKQGVLHWLDENFEKMFLVTGLLSITLFITWQVIYRYIITQFIERAGAAVWTEELSRYIFIWISYLALSVAIKKRSSIRVDMLYDHLPPRLQQISWIVVEVLFFILTATIAYYGWGQIERLQEYPQHTTALRIPFLIPYLILPFGFGLMCFRLLQSLYKQVKVCGLVDTLIGLIAVFVIASPVIFCDYIEPLPALFGYFIVLCAIGVPVAISLGLSTLATIICADTLPIEYMAQVAFTSIDSFPIMAIPFFIAAGVFMGAGGLSHRLLSLADEIVGGTYGGIGLTAIVTCMFFGAISGSGPATVAAIGALTIPAMVERGYDKYFSAALVAAAGCVGVMIPPSNPFVVYGISAQVSIGDLFMSGIVPGIMVGIVLMTYCYWYSRKKGWRGQEKVRNARTLMHAAWDAKWALMVPVIVLGGIYGGIMTPTEAGAIAGLYALLVSFLIYRLMSWRTLKQVLVDTMKGTGSVSIMIGAASAISFIFAKEQIGTILGNWLLSVTANKYVFLFAVNIIILILGCLVDTSVIQLVMIPILWPVAEAMGINIIHFGLIICFNMMVGLSTPPFGMCLFITSGISGTPLKDIIREIWWPIIVMLIVLAVITYIPDVVLFLPKLTGMMA